MSCLLVIISNQLKRHVTFYRQRKYFWHIISQRGIDTVPDKTRVARECSIPKTKSEVKNFGELSYDRQFILKACGYSTELATWERTNVYLDFSFSDLKMFQFCLTLGMEKDSLLIQMLLTHELVLTLWLVLTWKINGCKHAYFSNMRVIIPSEKSYWM